jgi:threonine dehydrogenase-like Zn-dependent dehydrogenase
MSAVGIALALKKALQIYSVSGKVVLLGTPGGTRLRQYQSTVN